MLSNEATLIRKGRKHNSKCDSPCQVVSMMISTKVGYQTQISQLKSYRVRNSLKTVLSGWSDKWQVFCKNSQRISKLSPQMVSKSLAKLIWVLVKDIVQGNICTISIRLINILQLTQKTQFWKPLRGVLSTNTNIATKTPDRL